MNSDETLAISTQWLASLAAATDGEAFAAHFLPTGWMRGLQGLAQLLICN
jgi:hypothetical protein